MHRFASRSLLALAAALSAVAVSASAFAQEHGGGEAAAEGSGSDVLPMVIWSLCALLVLGVFLSIFYLLKRRVGGFPKNPDWVAPITIMPSKDFPSDTDPHEAGHDDLHHAAAHH